MLRTLIKIALIIVIAVPLLILKEIVKTPETGFISMAIGVGLAMAIVAIWNWKPKSEEKEDELTIDKK